MKKKILVILDSLCFGGREKIVVDVCNNLNPEKYEVVILTLCEDNNPLRMSLKPHIHFQALQAKEKEITGLYSILFFIRRLPVLENLIRNINPDIIHTHSNIHRLLLVNIAIRRSAVISKDYHSIHTDGLHYSNDSFLSKIKRQIEKLSFQIVKPRLIAVSKNIEKNNLRYYRNYFYENRYIPNGIDISLFQQDLYTFEKYSLGLNAEDIMLVYPARLEEGKNHLTLLKAVKRVIREKNNVKLVLAGDGLQMAKLVKYTEDERLLDNVMFLGNVHNIPEILSIADIGVFPSAFEGFGIGLIEMLAMELPVIASDIPIFREYIAHMENGLLNNVYDDEEMANQLLFLIDNKEIRHRLGKGAREKAIQFSLNESIIRLSDYYES